MTDFSVTNPEKFKIIIKRYHFTVLFSERNFLHCLTHRILPFSEISFRLPLLQLLYYILLDRGPERPKRLILNQFLPEPNEVFLKQWGLHTVHDTTRDPETAGTTLLE